MPRFFFHLAGPGEDSRDDEGVDFATVEEAFLDLYRAVLDMSYEMLLLHRDPHRHRFDVRDTAGHFLFELPFSEVLRPSPRDRANLQPLLFEVIEERMRRGRDLKSDIVITIAEAAANLRRMQHILRGEGPGKAR